MSTPNPDWDGPMKDRGLGEIFLQCEDGDLRYATWCQDRINEDDVRYVSMARIRSVLTDEVLQKLEHAAIKAWKGASLKERNANSREALREGIVAAVMKEGAG